MRKLSLVAGTAVLLLLSWGSPSTAEDVLRIGPDGISALPEQDFGDRLMVIHYTSDDGSCSYCIDSNAAVAEAARDERFVFVQVIVNPWRAYFEPGNPAGVFQESIGHRLAGVPAAMVFSGGRPVTLIDSIGPDFAADLEQARHLAMQQAEIRPGPVSVSRIPSSGIEAFVGKAGHDRPMVITISSTDPACSHCIDANAAVDEASRHLAESYTFVRIDFDPWRSFSTDAALADFLSAQGSSINGLPTSFLVNDGQILGQMPTLRGDLRSILVQALPGIQQ